MTPFQMESRVDIESDSIGDSAISDVEYSGQIIQPPAEETRRKKQNAQSRAKISTVIERFDQFERRYGKMEEELAALSKKHHRRYGPLDADVKQTACILGTNDLLWPRVAWVIRYHKTRVKPGTFSIFESVMRGFCDWINLNKNFKEENIKTLEDSVFFILRRSNHENILIANDWLQFLLRKKISGNTIRYRLSALASLFKSAKILGIVKEQPRYVKIAESAPVKRTVGPSRKKLAHIIQTLEGQTDPQSVQCLAILRLMFDLGGRVNEIASIKRTSIDFEERTVKYVVKRGTEPVVKHLPEPTLLAVKRWMELDKITFYGRRKHDYRYSDHVFHGWYTYNDGSVRATEGGRPAILYKAMVELGRRFGVDLGPNKIRHASYTIACEEAQARGLPIESVMAHTGHKRLQTILTYRDNIPSSQLKISSLVANAFV